MSTLKVNNLQVGQDSTAANNLTWFQPSSPDGTIRLGSGNAGSATSKFTFANDGTLTATTFVGNFTGKVPDWITHDGDTNTKFGFPAVDTIAFHTNGGERLRIDDNGKVLVATTTTSEAHLNQDELIIGSTSDDANHGLTIVTPDDKFGTVAFSDGASGKSQGLIEYNHSGDYMRFYVNAGSEKLRIDSSGRVLIGTTTAGHANADELTLGGTGSGARGGLTINSHSTLDGSIHFGDGDSNLSGQINYHHNDNTFRFYTAGTEKAAIDNNGNFYFAQDTNTYFGRPASDTLAFYTAGGERLIIKSGGQIGIGINAPAEKLNVAGTIGIVGGTLKLDTHPLVSTASFTDISGGSYAARLGSTGTSTIRSTQIYGGGGHIATFDGVNNRLGVNQTAPNSIIEATLAGECQMRLGYNQSKYVKIGRNTSGHYEFISQENGSSLIFGTSESADGAGRAIIHIDRYGDTHIGDRSGNQNASNWGHAKLNICGDHPIATSFTAASSYLHIGGSESTSNGLQTISFGHVKEATTHVPAYLGYKTTNSGSNECGDFVFGTRSVVTDTAPSEVLRIGNDGILQQNRGGLKPGTFSNIAGHGAWFMPSVNDGYNDKHILSISQYAGNWSEGAGTSNYDTSWGLGWFYQSGNNGNCQQRAGIAYDHKSSERFKIWSSYGPITFKLDSANSGNETSETCDKFAMIMEKTGVVRKPEHPAFDAYINTTTNRNNQGLQQLPFDSTRVNNGSYFSTSNKRFDAPVNGVYYFSLSLNIKGRVEAYIRKNGSTYHGGEMEIIADNIDGWRHITIACCMSLTAGQYADCAVNLQDSNAYAWNGGTWDSFSGYLIG